MTMEDGEKILFESHPNLIQEFTEEIGKASKQMKGNEARKLQKYL